MGSSPTRPACHLLGSDTGHIPAMCHPEKEPAYRCWVSKPAGTFRARLLQRFCIQP